MDGMEPSAFDRLPGGHSTGENLGSIAFDCSVPLRVIYVMAEEDALPERKRKGPQEHYEVVECP